MIKFFSSQNTFFSCPIHDFADSPSKPLQNVFKPLFSLCVKFEYGSSRSISHHFKIQPQNKKCFSRGVEHFFVSSYPDLSFGDINLKLLQDLYKHVSSLSMKLECVLPFSISCQLKP